MNVTIPVGVPTPGATAFTVAVKSTDCPNTDGFTDDTTDVVVAAMLTLCVSVEEVLLPKFESPLYAAVIECEPTISAEEVNVATPDDSAPVPNVVVPSLNVTVPVGVPVPDVGVTVAVNVTD